MIIFYIILLAISIFRFYVEYYSFLSVESLSVTLITVAIALSVFLFHRDPYHSLRKNYLKISTLFIVGYILVHFFEYLAFVIKEHDQIVDVELIDVNYVNGAAICSLCLFLIFLIGYCATNKGFSANYRFQGSFSKRFLEYVMLFSLVVFYFSAGPRYFNGGYGEMMNQEGGMPLFAILSQTFLRAAQIACSVVLIYKFRDCTLRQYIRSYSWVYYLSLLIYCFLVLKSGDRGPLFQTALCYVVTFFIINRYKLRLMVAILCICFAAFSLSFLGFMRAMEGDLSVEKIENTQIDRTRRLEGENPIFASTAELSRVVKSYHVLYYYTNEHGIIYGLGFVDQLLGIIPGLRYFLYPLLGIDVSSTATLITEMMNSDHGMGTTCVADTYFNLGFIGSLIVFLVCGIIARKMDINSYNGIQYSHPFIVCLILSYFSSAITIGRATFFTPFNVLAYSYAFFYINQFFARK